jgi:hypothetical protein
LSLCLKYVSNFSNEIKISLRERFATSTYIELREYASRLLAASETLSNPSQDEVDPMPLKKSKTGLFEAYFIIVELKVELSICIVSRKKADPGGGGKHNNSG